MPSAVVGLGLAPEKKINFAPKNCAILSKFWYFVPILQDKNLPEQQRKWGIIPSPKSGGPIPLPLPAPTPMGRGSNPDRFAKLCQVD